MARVVVLSGDLMFASRIAEALGAAGHEVELASGSPRARELAPAADVLVADLADEGIGAIDLMAAMAEAGELTHTRTLGFYPHVEPQLRDAAAQAGVQLVVPRSRMAREGPQLVASLISV